MQGSTRARYYVPLKQGFLVPHTNVRHHKLFMALLTMGFALTLPWDFAHLRLKLHMT